MRCDHTGIVRAGVRHHHHLHVPVRARDTQFVIPFCTDHTCYLGAMAPAVHIIVHVDRVPATEVVHVSIVVIVNGVVRDLRVIVPCIVDQVVMGQVRLLNNAHHNGIAIGGNAACAQVPRRFAPDILVVPLAAIIGVVGHVAQFHRVVVLCQQHIRVVAYRTQHHRLFNGIRVELQQPSPHRCTYFAHHTQLRALAVDHGQIIHQFARIHIGLEHHQDISRYEGRLLGMRTGEGTEHNNESE